jgi:hypothetical protein
MNIHRLLPSGRLAICLAAIFVLGALPLTLPAQPAVATQRVLELDGNNSYVQLPDDIFHEFTEGTVEAWIYPNHWDSYQRFFNFGGYQYDMGMGRLYSGQALQFFVSDISAGGEETNLRAEAQLPAREWLHLTAVSGPGGMEMYWNGVLLAANSFGGSFQRTNGKQNFIGAWHRGGGEGLSTFDGRIAEVRVWKVRRTAGQIREGMFQRLTGTEPGLAGLWNFADVTNGVVKDLSPCLLYTSPSPRDH